MKKLFHLTPEGIAELQTELKDRNAQRPVIADKIKTAREFGDLSENAEYSTAMAEKEQNETRLAEIEHILANVEPINGTKNATKVRLGSDVKLKGPNGKTMDFKVVGSVEANPLEGKISDESPIGKALLGKKIGEEVEIKTPAETVSYKLVEIS